MFLTYTGMETDLLFTKGVALPGFASYPLLDHAEGRALLRQYYNDMIQLGATHGVGVILESATWVASRDRGAALGHSPEDLQSKNRAALVLMDQIRTEHSGGPIVLSANIGPRADAYAPASQMTVNEAAQYHAEQIKTLSGTPADMISAYTIAYPEEAIGMVMAARKYAVPIVVAFTVEVDGRLPTGVPLGEAIMQVDNATDHYASYFMINCAHPDHFDFVLSPDPQTAPWKTRLKGLVANASRCRHAELDEATTLDDGNPKELAAQLSALHRAHPTLTVLGGCCGTDMRHMTAIAERVSGVS